MSEGARRRRVKTLKQQLPYPYDQDLSPVLRNLNRRTPFGRRRQANDPVTAAYLAAAVRLIQRHLGPGGIRTPEDPEDPDSIPRPLLNFLSQRAVAAEVDHNPARFTASAVFRRCGSAGGTSPASSPTCSGSACGHGTIPARTRTRWPIPGKRSSTARTRCRASTACATGT